MSGGGGVSGWELITGITDALTMQLFRRQAKPLASYTLDLCSPYMAPPTNSIDGYIELHPQCFAFSNSTEKNFLLTGGVLEGLSSSSSGVT